MKRLITITFTTALACAMALALTACGQQGGGVSSSASEEGSGSESASESTEVSESSASDAATKFETIKDVDDADTEYFTSGFVKNLYVCAFLLDGTWWRVEAPVEESVSKEIDKYWTEDQDKVDELISTLKVTKVETLEAPSEEEIEALVGKTGADVSDDGFTFLAGGLTVNGNETDCSATKGSFGYLISFDGAVPDENTDNPASAVADMKVISADLQGVTFEALGITPE